MNYWLIKSEPEEYSFADLKKDTTTPWTGVRNYAARNNLRAMKKGDLCMFYHSVSDKEIVGLCKVHKEAYIDPTSTDGDRWSAVDIKYLKPLKKPVHFHTLKAMESMQTLELVRLSRLSVMPVSEQHWDEIMALAGM